MQRRHSSERLLRPGLVGGKGLLCRGWSVRHASGKMHIQRVNSLHPDTRYEYGRMLLRLRRRPTKCGCGARGRRSSGGTLTAACKTAMSGPVAVLTSWPTYCQQDFVSAGQHDRRKLRNIVHRLNGVTIRNGAVGVTGGVKDKRLDWSTINFHRLGGGRIGLGGVRRGHRLRRGAIHNNLFGSCDYAVSAASGRTTGRQ
jgi:hypothetical protein